MTTNNKDNHENGSKSLGILFLDMKDYNFVLSTIDAVQNKSLQEGKKIRRYEALTKIIKEWKNKTV